MSAESLRKKSYEKCVGKVILPQIVEDKSLIDSFTGFIQDVVPQAYGCSPPSESKEKILWARFEYCDVNDPIFHSEAIEPVSAGLPILLVLGYSFGCQIWSITANGEATELLSWFHGTTRFVKLIPSPATDQTKQDPFAHRRPLAAVCESVSPTVQQFCTINFLSLRGGDVVKSIKFKSPILDVTVNRISIIVSFIEKIAIFNALTIENSHTITTCYATPGYNLNPIALGPRWLAYSEQRLISWIKSSGGCESESAPSYTATVLNAAKTLSQGLKDLSGSVASSLSGTLSTSPVNSYMHMAAGFHRSDSSNSIGSSSSAEYTQPGIVTIVDIQAKLSDDESERKEGIIAHFVAHPEPIVSLCFDPSGVLLLTADKKGHRFHVFRIQPHLLGSSYTSVHHLYVLYRGDTSARVQDMTFSVDSRWVAVSSLRGTTHVFPVTPYGGPIGLRTHSTPHVVNKLSRFHRSAGIITDGRNSPVPHEVLPLSSSPTSMSFPNPCLPPFPHPTVVTALAQIRSQSTLLPQTRHSSPQNQEECLPSLKVVASFAPPRLLDGLLTGQIGASYRKSKNAADSLFIMSSQGILTQYDLEPLPASGIPKDKLCDESPIELKVEAKVQWYLLQTPPLSTSLAPIEPPLSCGNPLLSTYASMKQEISNYAADEKSFTIDDDDKWLSQVEIVTHIGPHRRIWMGPQFTFKPILKNGSGDLETSENNVAYTAKSNPVNMPANYSKNQAIPLVPLYIESGSSSSLEQSPKLLETYGGDSDSSLGTEELKIQEDIADAMLESPISAALKSGMK
ncbi:breast carcinoma-amplified sequence 3 homolog isoform X2 [Planococcus citri]|uniref:breast carcinoma-amplified sequence 3 homolog isoform X2 n=1 Tax=Planococcus citri TaxID=170843 RepID=UPI0031F88EE0